MVGVSVRAVIFILYVNAFVNLLLKAIFTLFYSFLFPTFVFKF